MSRKDKKRRRIEHTQEKVNSGFFHKSAKTNWKVIFFIIFSFILLVHLIGISIIVFSKDNGLSFYGVTRLEGILFDQEVDSDGDQLTLQEDILRLKAIDHTKIDQSYVSKKIIVQNVRETNGKDYLCVAQIISVDEENKKLTIAIMRDYTEAEAISFDDAKGIYDGSAKLFGKMVYVSSQTEGYIFVTVASFILSISLYYGFIKTRKQ
jgi:hypothetical protein